MTVIDLGEFNNSLPSEPETPTIKTEFNPHSVRRMLLTVIVLACAFLVAPVSRPGCRSSATSGRRRSPIRTR